MLQTIRESLATTLRAALVFTGLAATITAAGAQGILLPDRPLPPPGQMPRPVVIQPFYVKNLRVHTVITDAVAETTVEQTFVNTASVQQEGTYLYPLPEGATPSGFSMTVGDRTMEPKVLSSDEAHSIYEGYVRRYKDPALLEYVGRGLVKISVFPIPPQGERTIRMRYTQILKPQGGLRQYSYPLSTSRFGNRPVGVATLTVKLNTTSPIKNVYSPSHDISIRKMDDRSVTAAWEGQNESSDRDLTLFFSTGSDDVGLSLLTYKSGDRDGYFMLLASPRVTIPRDKILPKHVVFVLDRTGSMQGKKIEQARKSLLFCLDGLNPKDRFDVITFNESPDVLFPGLVPVNADNLAKARRFVENIEASGGTNINDALKSALSLFSDEPARQNMVVFLTDGLPTVGETNINTILQQFRDVNGDPSAAADVKPHGVQLARATANKAAGKHVRLFCFGLGYDVNVPFLDRLADLGRGESDYVKPEEDVEAKVSAFYAKVTAPILANVKLTFDGADTYDIYPKVFPDLFKGSQLVITGRFRGGARGSVQLSGLSNGSVETFKMETAFGEATGAHTFLPRIWAARKLGYLIDQVRLSDNAEGKKEVIDEIVRLSKDYGIITEYTSFLVDDREQMALNVRPGSPLSSVNAPVVRGEILRRSRAYGESGAQVTDQSGRAKDLKNADQLFSRYQSANGSVRIQYGDNRDANDSVALGTPAEKGNFQAAAPALGVGGQGGFGGGDLGGKRGAAGPGGFGGGGRVPARGKNGGLSEQSNLAEQLTDKSRNAISVQVVADRTFYLQANRVWQDHSYDAAKNRLVKIQAFSDAHFALMRAMPRLGAFSSVGDELIVRIGANAVQIGSSGKEKLTAAEIKEIVGR